MEAVVLISGHHIGSIVGLNELVKYKDLKIKAVMESDIIFNSKKGAFKELYSLMSKSGLYFSLFMGADVLMQKMSFIYAKIFKRKSERKLFTVQEITHEHNIPYYGVGDINSPEIVNILKEMNPNFIISMFFGQILKKDVLSIPKYGCVNLHPGLLPRYRGCKPSFWAMLNDDDTTGVTVHFMDDGIDTGQVLDMREFKIKANHSFTCLVNKSARIGVNMLVKQIKRIKEARANKRWILPMRSSGKSGYYSIPKSNDVRLFKSKGRRFMRLRGFVSLF